MPLDVNNGPVAGTPLSPGDLEMIFEAVKKRQENFPDEGAGLSFWFVLQGIGERFRRIECTEQEWTSSRKDIDPNGPMTCPNGHDLHEGPGVTIGWVAVN